MSRAEVKIIDMSKIKPGTIEKSSSTVGPPAAIGLLSCLSYNNAACCIGYETWIRERALCF